MSTEQWSEYVARVIQGKNQSQIAYATGVNQTAIGRWLRGDNTPRADLVVEFARALNLEPLAALVAAGYITAEEAGANVIVRAPLADYSIDELLTEIRDRTEASSRRLRPDSPDL